MNRRRKVRHGVKSRQVKLNHKYFWFGRFAAVIVAALGIVLFTRDDSTPDDFVPQVIGAPRVAVAQDTFDYGDIRLGTTIETVFKVQNVGDKSLTILDAPQVEVLEGCWPKSSCSS